MQAQRGITRRGIASAALHATCLLSYLFFTIGVPLPARKAKWDSDPFPCQNNPCGCQTARQCWTSCQCYTPAERVRWSVRNGVTIPDYAVLPPPEEMARILDEDTSADHCEESDGCCCCCKKENSSTEVKKSGPVRIALASAVAKCCGLSLDSVASVDVTLPPLTVKPEAAALSSRLDAPCPSEMPSISIAPPSPPPRIAVS